MSNVPIPHTYSGRCIMTSLWVIGLFLIGDCISTSSPLKAKEGSCVKISIDMKFPMEGGNVVWLKNATWNSTSNDFEGTVVYSLKADKPAAKEFENRVSVDTSPDRTTSQLTISQFETGGQWNIHG
ncbi:hypothetical protein COCON_G00002330 [Conger conger]|uniref:B-cell receptor CD22 first Ig-like domain-containing protein n=1 Tax=Conger conger TaxID=82655 RepID=A0A9Q1E1H1_CONCO|nr:hypothetical protein COCON_G00002330 [Conger conger]